MPQHNFGRPVGVARRPGLHCGQKRRTGIDVLVHRVQIDRAKQRFAPRHAKAPVVIRLGLPADQHIANVENYRLGWGHGCGFVGSVGVGFAQHGRGQPHLRMRRLA